MPYTAEQIAAFIGAAAWAPQIASWAYKTVQRSKVVIIPDSAVELGFTNLGPIFNVRLAVSTDARDVLLDSFAAEVTHENGDGRLFHWRGTRETLNQVRDATGIRQTVERDDSGIAIKVRPDLLVEKFFRFQDSKFQSSTKASHDELMAHFAFLKTTDTNARGTLFRSDRFHSFLNLYKSAFSWRPGTYKVKFHCKAINSKINQKPDEFVFELRAIDIEHLHENFDKFASYLEWHLFGATEAGASEPTFNWRYPALTRLSAGMDTR